VCSVNGCAELVSGAGRCPTHAREADKARGKTYDRGYDRAHVQKRKREARTVASGTAECWSCGQRISPFEPFHLGHCEDDRNVTHGPEHPGCNLGHRGKACPHQAHSVTRVGEAPQPPVPT